MFNLLTRFMINPYLIENLKNKKKTKKEIKQKTSEKYLSKESPCNDIIKRSI